MFTHINICRVFSLLLYLFISNDTIISSSGPVNTHLVIWRGATVTITGDMTFTNGSKVIVDGGSTLHLVGGTLNNIILLPQSGSTVILENNAKIFHNTATSFLFPTGATMNINYGQIQ